MSLLLNIDTSVETASVCLAQEQELLQLRTNPSRKDHAAWLHPAILDILQSSGVGIGQLDAVAICHGPGSYTGLRVAMAAAKGLCYALDIPLITLNTLKVMAWAGSEQTGKLLCPMIDARRMEVFTAIYDPQFREVMAPVNLILDENTFSEVLIKNEISFFGNGSNKFRQLIKHPHASFADVHMTAAHMVSLSYEQFSAGDFTDIAYAEPFYGKDFYSTFK